MMTNYAIRIAFDDLDTPVFVELPGLALEQAEQATAELRYDVEQAKSINVPVIEENQIGVPGTDIVFDPRRVISIDLEEIDAQDIPAGPTDTEDGPIELDGPLSSEE